MKQYCSIFFSLFAIQEDINNINIMNDRKNSFILDLKMSRSCACDSRDCCGLYCIYISTCRLADSMQSKLRLCCIGTSTTLNYLSTDTCPRVDNLCSIIYICLAHCTSPKCRKRATIGSIDSLLYRYDNSNINQINRTTNGHFFITIIRR
jgi:hypothetical protein